MSSGVLRLLGEESCEYSEELLLDCSFGKF